ncbi:MAG: ThiF family adenylyltransferase [Methanobacteriota archaeon]|nr:MAG: ThiF family adenylyltransferase [Euryarchaeota archaeon]
MEKIAVVGLGGVGSFCAELLAREGHSLILIDYDTYESKNTNQHMFREEHIGKKKVDVVKERLSSLTSVETLAQRVEESSFKASIVVDCTDNRVSRLATLEKAKEMGATYAMVGCSGEMAMTTIGSKGIERLYSREGSAERSSAVVACSAAALGVNNLLNYLRGDGVVFPKAIIFNVEKNIIEVVDL